MIMVSVSLGSSSISPTMEASPEICRIMDIAMNVAFLSDVTQQNLDLKFTQSNNISVVQRLFSVRVKAAPIKIRSIGRTQVHDDNTIRFAFDNHMQTRYTRRIGLIGCQVDIRHDGLALTQATQGKFIT